MMKSTIHVLSCLLICGAMSSCGFSSLDVPIANEVQEQKLPALDIENQGKIIAYSKKMNVQSSSKESQTQTLNDETNIIPSNPIELNQSRLTQNSDSESILHHLESIQIEEDFNFEMQKNLEIKITDPDLNAKYIIYQVDPHQVDSAQMAQLFSQGQTTIRQKVNIFVEELLLVRSTQTETSYHYAPINDDLVQFNFSGSDDSSFGILADGSALVVPQDRDIIFYTNSSGDLGYIDKETLVSTKLADLPAWINTAITCAFDPDNERIFIQDRVSPYGISYYDLHTGVFHQVGTAPGLNSSFPWMAFNKSDKLLYVGNSTTVYVLDPSTSNTLSSLSINGYSGSTGGGDLDFDSEFKMYGAPNSGLYSITTADNIGLPSRISGESLPFYITSLTIDDDDIVWLASNDAEAKVMNMDTVTGDYILRQTFNHKINDFAYRPKDASNNISDRDGDGVIDEDDEFPDDPEIVGAVYSPSKFGTGSLAFEDMWPQQGDYDFNDLVIGYKMIKYVDRNNQAVKMTMNFSVMAIGAELRNGFGIELPISKDLISSVTGTKTLNNVVNLDEKNLEKGHSKAVIIVFDNANENFESPVDVMTRTSHNQSEYALKELEIEVRFTESIDMNLLTGAPYNPFIFSKSNRNKEVHLPGQQPTALANQSIFKSGEDHTDLNTGYTYKNSQGLPWAINIPHKFRVPLERVSIDQAYNKFVNFAASPGSFTDWYTDAPGNRVSEKIYFPQNDPALFTN